MASITDLIFTLHEDSYYSVRAKDKTISGVLEIPAEYNGLPVTKIESSAFSYCYELTRVSIPESITTICQNCFFYCYKLHTLILNCEIPTLEECEGGFMTPELFNGFVNCKSLKGIWYTKENAFYEWNDMFGDLPMAYIEDVSQIPTAYSESSTAETDANGIIYELKTDGTYMITGYSGSGGALVIPDKFNNITISEIGKNAFNEIKTITSITFNSTGLKKINDSAFYNCTKVVGPLILPEGLTYVGNYSFNFQYGITEFHIPSTLTSMGGSYPLWRGNCPNLSKVTVAEGNTSYYTYNNQYLIKKSDNSLIRTTAIGNIVLPDCIKKLNGCCFGYTNSAMVKTLVLNEHITELPWEFIYQAHGLTAFNVTKNIKSIYVAGLCNNGLTSLTVDPENTKYHSKDNCIIITETNTLVHGTRNSIIPDYVTKLSSNCYYYTAPTSTNFIIPKGVTEIPGSAFQGCSSANFKKITIKGKIKKVNNYAFQYCTNLVFNSAAFASCTYFGTCAFDGAKKLKTMFINEKCNTIGSYAFRNCIVLERFYNMSKTKFGTISNLFTNTPKLTQVYYGTDNIGYNEGETWNGKILKKLNHKVFTHIKVGSIK